jgi:hypothetical protein
MDDPDSNKKGIERPNPPKDFNGRDIKIVLAGPDQMPEEVLMEKKETVDELKAMHGGDAIVYLGNNNLHLFPRRLKGAIMWVKCHRIVGAVIQASHTKAFLLVIHPKSREGEKLFIDDLRIHGCYLQLVIGNCPLPINYKQVRRDTHGDGNPVALVDRHGYVKINVRGPDFVVLPNRSVPQNIKKVLRGNRLTTLNTAKLPKRTKLDFQAMVEDQETRDDRVVPVVYVYQKDSSCYTYVQRYLDRGQMNEVSREPVFLIPIGDQYVDSTTNSSRWLCVMSLVCLLTCADMETNFYL